MRSQEEISRDELKAVLKKITDDGVALKEANSPDTGVDSAFGRGKAAGMGEAVTRIVERFDLNEETTQKP